MANKRYIPVRVQIHRDQEKRIRNAVHRQKGVSIHFSSISGGNHNSHKNTGILCLTQQLFKVRKAPVGTQFSFAFSPAQVKANMKHEGGFLPILAAVLSLSRQSCSPTLVLLAVLDTLPSKPSAASVLCTPPAKIGLEKRLMKEDAM